METNKEGDVTLSVVMPAYNEGAHITDNLLETSRVLSGFVKRYEIIAVDDGSADNTAECIRRAEMQDTHIRGISYQPNGGKGHAIRTGIVAAEGRYIAFLDSDLELPPILLKRFLKDMKEQDADIVIGSKLHPESKLHYPMLRKIMSYGYYLMLKMMFHLNTHDTQTGIKLFKKEVIKPIVSRMQAEGYAFDIVTVRAHQANSHRGHGWEQFTDACMKMLNRQDRPIVFSLYRDDMHKKKLRC